MAKAKTAPARGKKAAGDSAVIDLIRSKFGKDAAGMRTGQAQMTEFISTGVDTLDHYVIGRGGLPVGRSSEVFGENACGKTSLMYSAGAACQRMGGTFVIVDQENSYDEERAETFGVDLDTLIILQPKTLEDALEMHKDVLHGHNPKKGPMLIGWDSLASSKTKNMVSGHAGDQHVGEIARLMSEEMAKINNMLGEARAHWMIINQLRTKFGVMFGDNTTTPGGNAPKYHASVRIQFFGGKKLVNSFDEHVGKVVTILAVKNRLAPPFRKARVRFDYATGYNNVWTTLEHAKRFKKIDPRKDGFKGAAAEGLPVYLDALEKLGWESTVPIPEELIEDDVTEEGDDAVEDDEDD